MDFDFQTLRVEAGDTALTVSLNRPEVRNAINQQMVDELHQICAELERNPKILILTGSEKIFASGADISQLRERRRDEALQGINSALFTRIARLPMPVIAAMSGYAMGGGAELGYAADFRLGSTTLKIGNPETALGIVAGAGATWRLKELVGEPLAKEILLAGRVLDAQEALAVRLVTEVHPPEELLNAAYALADRIARQDSLAVRITKSVFHAPAEAHPVIDQLAQGILFDSPAKFERMDAFLNKSTTRGTGSKKGE
ncbi:enoyl-CoA hydratase/isomerase family protein [Pseudarthrobacter sp. J1738]|uniref:enoyl-CoA hydratase/isomerase family protein n=1 Tax=unclassified Pseudarthrobacter TaxID=2647000 RepID=UPI003D272AD3